MEEILREEQGNLFEAPREFSLAHCVSRDFKMGKGIALEFRNRFGRVEELRRQNPEIGGLSYIVVEGRYVFYLVTKERYFQIPTYENLTSSLERMRDCCRENNITRIAIPRIGCGLDKLIWENVRNIILQVFTGTGIAILVYTL